MNTSRLSKSELYIVEAAQSMGITNPIEIAQMLAQMKTESNLQLVDETLRYGAEFLYEKFPYSYVDKKGKPRIRSWGFKSKAEAEPLCCGKDRVGLANRIYGGRLGNNNPGDGFKYRGRGYIQLTGKEMYQKVGAKIGVDLVNNPDLVMDPRYASKVAIQIYWKDKVQPRVSDFSDTTKVTLAVNGGDIGLAERKENFKYYSEKLGLGSAQDTPPVKPTPTTPPPKNVPAPLPRPPAQPVTQPTTTTPVPRNTVEGVPPQQPIQNYSEYVNKIYIRPFKEASTDIQREILYTKTNANEYFRNYLGNLRGVDNSRNTIVDYLVILDKPDLDGDLLLIDSIIKKQEKQTQETKTILDGKLGGFSPDAKLTLIASSLFEMYPDDMRNKMSENSAKGGVNANYSHAWRAPGKLSITADFTIPGFSGLRVGQIFWIDKISSAYKEYGAFQLFGLTENIDISKGWTTSIHSRFNALPKNKNGGAYLTDQVKSGDTVQQSTDAKPQN